MGKESFAGYFTAAAAETGAKDDIPSHVLAQYFHLPEKQAAQALAKCLTSFKRICRRAGLVRWPYRKVRPSSCLCPLKNGS